ncbi:glycerol-3-phosphate dehydrogenase [Bacillus sp. SLBN-46]|uniref:glycerol-3-phosphate dehydrogenase/oxidase n=1 Tax=Bacillus sp. SLBN-46 TaxID=3042283 RepID=UPI00285EBE02|nr:FAD-dependent oxidoreductase [Bacillus sp. SLBN-46]MDR6124027.1 glycerol-3-phosphate dehydrogenase [Bacillus sp. SLBN-46]
MPFTNLSRKEIIKNLVTEEYDVLIIGGGITGAGIALDAATRGMKTALVEMQDFAAGTSSRSTKLVHGGLRYLKQLEMKMVAEVGKERAIVYENGPHVTKPEWMLLPIHQGGTFGKWSTSIGLRVYDFLAGVKKCERRRMLSERETLDLEPLIKKEGLKGGGCYVEYRTDDARLTIEVMKKAVENGVNAINYAKAEGFHYDNGQVSGIVITDLLGNETFNIRAKKVVNATGPWVDDFREKDNSKKGKKLRLSKGVHLVIDQSRFPLKQAVYFDTQDQRMVFAIPRNGKTYVGTTDTFYNGDKEHPKMTESDRNYIINAINYMFPTVQIKPDDIESSWAGVRPLIFEEGKNPSEISRKDEIWVSESGLITIAGGKLTGYRKMAETVVDLLSEKLTEETGKKFTESHTRNTPISGGEFGGSHKFSSYIKEQVKKGKKAGLSEEDARELALCYGTNVPILYDIVQNKELFFNNNKLPTVLLAKLEYAIQFEMVATPLDFFLRRTGDLLFNIIDVSKNKDAVIEYMAKQMGWTDEQKKIYFSELDYELYHARVPID